MSAYTKIGLFILFLFCIYPVLAIDRMDIQINLSTYDGSGIITHPSIIKIDEGFQGFKYWMIATPYKNSNPNYENPSIYYSNDGIYWQNISNPITKAHRSWYSHLNDPDIQYVNNHLRAIWLDSGDNISAIIESNSTNGKIWSKGVEIFRAKDFEIISPSMAGNRIYFVNTTQKGCSPTDKNYLQYIENGSIYDTDYIGEDNHVPWHGEVRVINGIYYGIFSEKPINAWCGSQDMIYLINSTDGIHWNKAGTPYIGLQSTPNTIYGASLSLYKPTILIEPDKTRIWYGDLYPKNIWKIEYTEEAIQTQPMCSTYDLTYIRTQIAKIKEQLTILEEMVK